MAAKLKRKRRPKPQLPTWVLADLMRIAQKLDKMPPEWQEKIVRALKLALALDEPVATRMLGEIREISVYGVDPDWQLERLKDIVQRWGATQ
jgi:hypothetical protein